MSRRHGFLLLGSCLLFASAAAAAVPLPAGALARRAPDRDHRETAVYWLAFAPDGKAVFICGAGAVRLWRWKDDRELKRWPTSSPYAASPDGRFLVATWNVPRLSETFAGGALHLLVGRPRYPAGVAVAADGRTVATGDQDRDGDVPATVRLRAVPGGKLLRTIDVGGRPAEHLAFSPDGKLLATGGCPIRLWDTATGERVRTFAPADGGAGPLAFTADGKTLASAGAYLRLWDVATGRPRHTLTASDEENRVTALALTADGKTLASAGTDRVIHLWDCASVRELAHLKGHGDRIQALAVAPDGKTLASCSADGVVLVWDLARLAAAARKRRDGPPPTDLARWWDALAGADAPRAYRAGWALAAVADRAVPYLAARLRPVRRDQAYERIMKQIRDLDDDQFPVRRKAREGLKKLGQAAELPLREVLEGRPTLEMRRSIEDLLAPLKMSNPLARKGEALRAARAVAVLERIGTPAARRLLADMAAGVPFAYPTQDAKAALRRLEGHKP